jgi:hypothetical protein
MIESLTTKNTKDTKVRTLKDRASVRTLKRFSFVSFVSFVVMVTLAISASAQRRGGRFGFSMSAPPNPKYDGAFMFCRIMFNNAANGDGGGWFVDYPRADVNLSFRLSELTTTSVSRDSVGEFNHAVIRLTDPELFRCPFIMLTEPGGAYLDPEEAKQLREYLLRGGFLWADDFWGEYAWEHWANELAKALPSGYPIVDLAMDHPLFHTLYDVGELPQIPSINWYFGSGGRTSERFDSTVPHARAVFDTTGHMMVLMTHNTDFGDAFEREGENREYFERFAGPGYAVGIDVLIYSMTH